MNHLTFFFFFVIFYLLIFFHLFIYFCMWKMKDYELTCNTIWFVSHNSIDVTHSQPISNDIFFTQAQLIWPVCRVITQRAQTMSCCYVWRAFFFLINSLIKLSLTWNKNTMGYIHLNLKCYTGWSILYPDITHI